MAFVNKKNWRCIFIDFDESFVVKTQEESVIGWMACRAPKGNTRATYFTSNNAGAIDALMGVGSANWPDLIEAKAFNAEYPIYISAPAGESKAYPSYLGGFYITRNGLYKFYNVKSKDDLLEGVGGAFKVKVVPTKESEFLPEFKNKKTIIELSGPNIPDYTPNADQIGYGFFSMKEDKEKSDVTLSFKKPSRLNVTAIDYDTMKKGQVSILGTDTTYWGDNDGLWSFTNDTATLTNFGVNYSDEQKADAKWNPLKDWIGNEAFKATEDDPEKIAKLLLNGFIDTEDGLVSIAFGLSGLFAYQVDIQDDVYAYFMQKSPTEAKTTITIKSIGYDKYFYNNILSYAPYDVKKYENEHKLYVKLPDLASDTDIAIIKNKIANTQYVVFYDESDEEKVPQFCGILNDEDENDLFYEETDNLMTQTITLQENLVGPKVEELYHKFFRIDGASNFTRLFTREEMSEIYGANEGKNAYEIALSSGIAAVENQDFNVIDIACSEEVYEGKTTSGGEFVGSLDQAGVNAYGNEIYLEDILQDDDASFIEVRVLKKFGDDTGDLDSNGFWRYNRIIDLYDADGDQNFLSKKVFTIEGDRYISLIMEKNLKLGKLGGEWDSSYAPIIREALEEACLDIYDDAYIFMEPTGREEFKEALASINRAQEHAVVISPKLLTPNEKGIITEQIANKVVVNGRINSAANAQFAGEFEVKDSITSKRYWRKPIGSVGKMIARSMDRMYGLVPCAWLNEGSLGGQLTDVAALKAKYSFDQKASKILDTKGINPIIMNGEDGVMITSNKTVQDPNQLSDWSYLNNAVSFVLIKREIRNKVMIPQIMKPITPYWMGIRQSDTEAICNKRTDMKNKYWHSCEVHISDVNTEVTKKQKLFVIKLVVYTSDLSEGVELFMHHKLKE